MSRISLIPSRLFVKLALALCAVTALNMAVVDVSLTRVMRKYFIHELAYSLQTQAQILASLPENPLFARKSDERLHEVAEAYGKACICRVTFIQTDGRILADSEVNADALPLLTNHSDRPEVQGALAGKRGLDIRKSNVLQMEMIYVAMPVRTPKGIVGAVRMGLPLTKVLRKLAPMRRTLAGLTAGLLALSLLVAFFLSRSIGLPGAPSASDKEKG